VSPLARRAFAELVGTAFLVAAVIGSGIAAQRLSPHDLGLQLLENSLITGAALVALILALQPVSAAFNPVITLIERAFGVIGTRVAATLLGAQLAGGILGALVANLMFGLDPVSVSTHHRAGSGLWLGEVVATLGLGGIRRRRVHHRGLLVHQLHQLRQPRRHRRADAVGHLRRHRADVRADVRADAAGWRRCGLRLGPGAVSPAGGRGESARR
jgi:hypothetical protein